MLFAGQNYLFLCENKFLRLFPSLLEKEESAKITQKNMHKRGVFQYLGFTLKRWLTPKSWSTPGKIFMKEKDRKTCFSTKKMIFYQKTKQTADHFLVSPITIGTAVVNR